MDDGLVLMSNAIVARLKSGLNPCCSGRWSRTCIPIQWKLSIYISLNPCCSGRWSRTIKYFDYINRLTKVLILVVVEDGLVPVLWHFAKYQWGQS